MNLFACPWCGPRDETEFYFGGEAGIVRPEPASTTSERAWAEYLFFRDNNKGRASELWTHVGGCGQWFILERNTVTHQVLHAAALDPDSDGGST